MWRGVLVWMIAAAAFAQTPDTAQVLRYEALAHELRCLVCQNQSLAESSADLASDLKREVKSLIAQGKTDAEIKTYLQTRYGDFILYKPPIQQNTLLLWGLPFAALAVGAATLLLVLRARRKTANTTAATLSEAEARELDERLR